MSCYYAGIWELDERTFDIYTKALAMRLGITYTDEAGNKVPITMDTDITLIP